MTFRNFANLRTIFKISIDFAEFAEFSNFNLKFATHVELRCTEKKGKE